MSQRRRCSKCSQANHHLPKNLKPTSVFSFSPISSSLIPPPLSVQPCTPPSLHFFFLPLYFLFPPTLNREGEMSEYVSLDVLSSSWHSVSQLPFLLMKIIGASMQHHTATHTNSSCDSTESHTDGLRQGPPSTKAYCVWRNVCNDIMCLPPPSQQSAHPPQAHVYPLYRHSCLLDEQPAYHSRTIICCAPT